MSTDKYLLMDNERKELLEAIGAGHTAGEIRHTLSHWEYRGIWACIDILVDEGIVENYGPCMWRIKK